MSWTDERIELLKSLWSDGKSASEIADFLGNVTRNAVIGKAHRLGLSGRPSPIKKVKPVSTSKANKKDKKNKNEKIVPVVIEAKAKKRVELKPHIVMPAPKAKKLPEKNNPTIPVMPIIPLRPEPKIDPDKLVGLLDLNERMCRWPVGDPKEAGFGFCGQTVAEGHLYCPAHVMMAYQISTKKSDERAKAEKRRKMALAAQMALEEDTETEEEEDIEVDIGTLEDIDSDTEADEEIDSEEI